jgi:hypothetical protein
MTGRLDQKRMLLGALVISMVAAVPTACTFIGAGIGAVASPERTPQRLPGYETQRIPIGTDVVVQMHSGEIVRGTYAGPLRDPYGMPVPNVIVLDRSATKRTLRIEEIYSVNVPGRTSGAWVGAAVGLAVDVLVIAAVASAMPDRDEKPKSETDGGWGSGRFSCPLVFGFDGQSYRLEAEVFGGALFPSMPRTDWARLDRAAEHDGELRLKITGQPGETQFLDELALVTVDHAPGTEVIPSRRGDFLLVSHAKPAIRARGFGGRDVLESVRAADERYWESNPFGRKPDVEEHVRDFIELDFERPAGADSATLALRVRNTSWGAHIQSELVALLGSGREAFERQLEQSPELRAATHAAMVREGMLLVKIFEDGAWRTVDHVWEVGPAAAREVAVPLELALVPDNLVKLRLESSVGLWRVDRARIDFGPVRAVAGQELAPSTVLDTRGHEHAQSLSRMDQRYVEMPWDADLRAAFSAPPIPHGQRRSVFVKASGWYRIHADDRARGRPDLVERMIAEPGAYGRFALQDLEKHVAEALR